MNAILVFAAIVSSIAGLQIPTSYNQFQRHLPAAQTYYSSYYPRNPSGPAHNFVHNSIQNSLGYLPPSDPQASNKNSLRCAFKTTNCVKSPYRSLDGTCNNLENPTWGAANTRYARLLPASFGDGISSPTISTTGDALPNPRTVSLTTFDEVNIPDPELTLANMQWGQIVAHDMSRLAGSTQSSRHSIRCCTNNGKLVNRAAAHKSCYPIIVSKDDPLYSQTHVECLNFVRALTDKDVNCPDNKATGPVEQLTSVTAYLDLSIVYGNSEEQLRPIRAFKGGRLSVQERRGFEWPPQVENVTATCDTQSRDDVCYLTGDRRANQNPGLTILQIVLFREHNRIADVLQQINPHWDDELTFQEARRINIAQYQQITYYEWLPIFLGEENMIKNRLIHKVQPGTFVNDYNNTIEPAVINSHATAAFRYFHTQIEGRLDLITEIRTSTGALRLSDWFNKPSVLETGDNYDLLTRGLATQPEQLTDINFDPEIRHFLFRRGRPTGADLRAIDIQRNRDHALARYNDFREFCGLRRATKWEDFLDLIPAESVENLKKVYTTFEDVDLTVGATLEVHVDGTLAGPTFLCILTEQFFRTRVADRFFFERGDRDIGFSRNQLIQIKKASLARLFCDNGNLIQNIQPAGFKRVSNANEIVPCSNIPEVDLSAWKDLSVENYSNDFDSFKK